MAGEHLHLCGALSHGQQPLRVLDRARQSSTARKSSDAVLVVQAGKEPTADEADIYRYGDNGTASLAVFANSPDGKTKSKDARYEYAHAGNTRADATTGLGKNRLPDHVQRPFSRTIEDRDTTHAPSEYRYDTPHIALWPSRDPIGERGGLNLYAFVGNNGVNWIDILGLRPFDTAREAFDAAASAAQKATQADVNMQAPVFKRPGGAFLIGPEKNLKREFCGLVCKKCGEDGKWKWDYTDPHAGKNWFKEEAPGIAVPQPSCEPNEATCKDGWERVGTYHSQPGEATPSRADWEAALWDGLRFRTGVFVPSLGIILPEPFSIGGPDGNFHWNW